MSCGRDIHVFFLGISHLRLNMIPKEDPGKDFNVRGKISKAGASVRLKLGSGGAAAPRGT